MFCLVRKILALIFFFTATFVRADENPYDVIAKTLTPFTALLAQRTEGLKKAVHARVSVSADAAAAAKSVELEIWLQAPDKLKVQTSIAGQPITLWRDGQRLFAAPGVQIRALLDSRGELPPPNPKATLMNFSVPIPDSQLPLLPAALQVIDDREARDKASVPLRILSVQIMPELAKGLGLEPLKAEATINSNDYKLRRLRLSGGFYTGQIIFEALDFIKNLPPETFRPDPAADTGVLEISPSEFDQLLHRK